MKGTHKITKKLIAKAKAEQLVKHKFVIPHYPTIIRERTQQQMAEVFKNEAKSGVVQIPTGTGKTDIIAGFGGVTPTEGLETIASIFKTMRGKF